MKIIKSPKIGFCYGVRRAIEIIEKEARQRGNVETLGEVVHNRHVMQRLTASGVKVADSPDKIESNTIVLGTHGTTPEVTGAIIERGIAIIDTTCPFVLRAQHAARRLAEAGFFLIVFGNANHAEVTSILGYAASRGTAATDIQTITSLATIPRRIGILSQTTQIPSRFTLFVKGILDAVYRKDSEIRIFDTICHDIRDRQAAALDLAKRVDVMMVVGGRNSANTGHLADLCATAVKTYRIESASDIDPSWFRGIQMVGITAGASTAPEEIAEVEQHLHALA